MPHAVRLFPVDVVEDVNFASTVEVSSVQVGAVTLVVPPAAVEQLRRVELWHLVVVAICCGERVVSARSQRVAYMEGPDHVILTCDHVKCAVYVPDILLGFCISFFIVEKYVEGQIMNSVLSLVKQKPCSHFKSYTRRNVKIQTQYLNC